MGILAKERIIESEDKSLRIIQIKKQREKKSKSKEQSESWGNLSSDLTQGSGNFLKGTNSKYCRLMSHTGFFCLFLL